MSPKKLVYFKKKGKVHSLAKGAAWSCGTGESGVLGHHDDKDRLVFTRIEAMHFDNAKIVSEAAGSEHSVAVTDHGALYTCGKGIHILDQDPNTLGGGGEGVRGRLFPQTDIEMMTRLVPERVNPHLLQPAC